MVSKSLRDARKEHKRILTNEKYECNGSDVFGSDICTCRPYLTFGIEEAVKEAQKGVSQAEGPNTTASGSTLPHSLRKARVECTRLAKSWCSCLSSFVKLY